MRELELTTPFGRRSPSLGQIAAQLRLGETLEKAGKPGSNHPAAVNKWTLFRTLAEAGASLGLSDRTLSLLNALLSFHPETALTLPAPASGDGEPSVDLVVFPSNRELSRRAHGMAEKTIRRHLSCLVEAGLIIRRDSPNGKRYARKAADGEEGFSQAFGFDLTPLVARAAEFEEIVEANRRIARRAAALREKITLHRRDIGKLIGLGVEQSLRGDWETLREQLGRLAGASARRLEIDALVALESGLLALRRTVCDLLEKAYASHIMTGNDGDNDRDLSNSNTQSNSDLEPAHKEQGRPPLIDRTSAEIVDDAPYPLGMVLEACPDIRDYGHEGVVRSWRELLKAAETVRPMLGISPQAWSDALQGMGQWGAAMAIAVVLQRSEHSSEATAAGPAGSGGAMMVNGSPAILSPGGYLRALTAKAVDGAFTAGPALMALISQRLKARRAGAGSSC
jgi:replication initiation protein RepC